MEDLIGQINPIFLVVIAAAAVSRIIASTVNWVGRKLVKPAIDATILHEIHTTVSGLRDEVKVIKSDLDEVKVDVKVANARFGMEFANGVPPDDAAYVPMRKSVEKALAQNETDHKRMSDNVETLFEMHGTTHDDVVAVMVKQERHEKWIAMHEQLTQAQATGGAT